VVSDAELLAFLREERDRQPDLAETLDLHVALLAARAEVAPRVPAGWVESVRGRLEAQLPALDLDHVDCDWGAVARLAGKICAITARHRPDLAEPLARVAARFALPGSGPRVADGADGPLFDFVLNHALHPVVQAYAAAASGPLGAQDWSAASCPVCGGSPDLAALEAESGERRLLCARCDHEWCYRRLGCPFCGNEDAATLGYFPAGRGGYRVSACERCRRYLKTVDRREMWESKPLVLERILTVGLDVAAASHGYRAS
jgi:hypothetical protein